MVPPFWADEGRVLVEVIAWAMTWKATKTSVVVCGRIQAFWTEFSWTVCGEMVVSRDRCVESRAVLHFPVRLIRRIKSRFLLCTVPL